jgi:DNA-directed RNA polymerase specialized sigma24 family protein
MFEPWSTVQWPHRCDTDLEALMGTPPCRDPDGAVDELQVIREALVDCLDQLSAEDRFVLEAIWFERVTVRALAVRLGIHKSRTHEISQRAVVRLGVVCAEHPVLLQRFAS